MFKKLQYLDYLLLVPYLILSAIGIIMVYSSSTAVAAGNGSSPTGYLVKQSIFVALGLFITFVVMNMKIKYFQNIQVLGTAMIVMNVVLFGLKLIGHTVNGAAGWINLGPISIQPAELCKFLVIIYLATAISGHQDDLQSEPLIHTLRKQLPWVGLMLLLILIEPDLGGMTINLAIVAVILFASGIRYWYGLATIFGFGLVYQFVALPIIKHLPTSGHSYMLARFVGFLHPFSTASTDGTQLVNSYYALANGGLFGVGLGNSIQKRGYLPEPNTDFIMSITAEELGLVGIILIMSLLLIIAVRTVYIGIRSSSTFNSLVCYGVGTYLTVQAFINVGGLTGIIPITGVTFPFISYGGSSTIVLTLSLGLVLNISALEKMKAANSLPQNNH